MAMGTRTVRPMRLSDCGCGAALAGIAVLLRGKHQQPTQKPNLAPYHDWSSDATWLGAVSDMLSDCSTATPADSSDDEMSESSDSPKSASALEGEAAIIFDWDDTLLMTSYIHTVLGDMKGAADASAEVQMKLAKHGAHLKAALVAARAAGRVSIVTLSARPWVALSAERYFPRMGIPALLDELDITVHYASEHATGSCVPSLEHFSAMKQSAMSHCLAQSRRKPKSVISIGDSIIEQHALKQLISQWGFGRPEIQKPFCKIVKLVDKPSLDNLTDELAFLESWLGAMAAEQNHFQLSVNNIADLRASALDFVKLLRQS